jgi:tetratricopeptide (TPR) repeat protein
VSLLCKGDYKTAAALKPEAYADADDAFFWATVLYDGGEYYEAINAVEKSKAFLRDYQNSNLFKTSKIAQIALESDAYMALSDYEGAENIRQEILDEVLSLPKKRGDDKLIPVIMVNSAIWAQNQKDENATADLLFDIVNNYPDFVPALILYADFAYESSLEREEDDEIKALRRAGISSLAMEKYDNRRKIPLSDAIYRINQCLAHIKEPYLEIEKLDLQYKADKTISEKEKTRDLWTLLENNYQDGEKYKELLVQYALNYLLSTKQNDDAWSLFYKYVYDKYHFNDKEEFFVQFAERVKEINIPLAEFGGYFACMQKKQSEAFRIYEFCVFESGGISLDGQVSTRVGTGSCMNLADMYFANGDKQKAMELYGKASGRELNNKLRSLIFYRLANIYLASGDNKNALRSADYACSIDQENERAFLLRTKLRVMDTTR